MTRSHSDKDSVMASPSIGFDVTPHATDELPEVTTCVMVDTDDTTITGYLVGDKATAHTTVPLKAGLQYGFRFHRITAVTGGAAKGYTS